MSNKSNLPTEIAQRCLDVDTLETCNSGDKDFHELGVWNIRRALEEAFEAGFSAGHFHSKVFKGLDA